MSGVWLSVALKFYLESRRLVRGACILDSHIKWMSMDVVGEVDCLFLLWVMCVEEECGGGRKKER